MHCSFPGIPKPPADHLHFHIRQTAKHGFTPIHAQHTIHYLQKESPVAVRTILNSHKASATAHSVNTTVQTNRLHCYLRVAAFSLSSSIFTENIIDHRMSKFVFCRHNDVHAWIDNKDSPVNSHYTPMIQLHIAISNSAMLPLYSQHLIH